MARFFCIGDDETVRGFALAGVDGQAVFAREQAAEALTKAFSTPDCGVVFITERWAASIPDVLEALRLERDIPVIAEIPGPEGQPSSRKTLGQLVQESVGYRVTEDGEGA